MHKYEHRVLHFSVKYDFHENEPDSTGLVERIQAEIKRLEVDGWTVVCANSVLKGHHEYGYEGSPDSYGWGYGYSTTDSILVFLRREVPA
jgi:hypothetical protein